MPSPAEALWISHHWASFLTPEARPLARMVASIEATNIDTCCQPGNSHVMVIRVVGTPSYLQLMVGRLSPIMVSLADLLHLFTNIFLIFINCKTLN